jgi:hypothetical protein
MPSSNRNPPPRHCRPCRPHAAYRDSPSMSNARGEHSAADVVAKAQAVLSEPELMRAMFDVGYFPPNTPRPPGD